MKEIDHALKLAIRREACQRIRCTALADPANKEGWLHGLIDFVAEKQRTPDAEEQARLRDIAYKIRQNLDRLPLIKPTQKVKGWVSLSGAGMTDALKRMRAAMLAKAEREVFGEIKEPEPIASVQDQAYADAMAAAPDRRA